MGILFLVLGVYAFMTPLANFVSLGWLLMVALLVYGVCEIISYFGERSKPGVTGWDLFGGVISVLLALLMLGNNLVGFLTDAVLAYCFGFWVLVSALLRIYAAIQMKKRGRSWVLVMLIGVIGLVVGIYAFLHPLLSAIALGWLIAMVIFVQGLNLLMLGITMK